MHTLVLNFEGVASYLAARDAIKAEGGNVTAKLTWLGDGKSGNWLVTSEWRVHLVRITRAIGHETISYPCVICT